jgi:phosphonate transport system ATP-binding protein
MWPSVSRNSPTLPETEVVQSRSIALLAEVAQGDIVVRDVTVGYDSSRPVVSNASFTVAAGETVALVGANGAGKSTLLKACLGLIRLQAGDIHMLGRSMVSGPARKRRQMLGAVGFVAQKHNLVMRLSVLSNVLHGCLARHPGPLCWLHATAPRKLRERAMEALERVGLAELALRRADTLSGGQQQRVAIARAIVGAPRLILADEPAASLDPAAGEEVMQVFMRVSRDTGTTLVFTTHHIDHALRHSRRILGLKGGLLAIDAPSGALDQGDLRGFYD